MTTLRVRGLLFDMDGTLIDSNALVEKEWAGFATRHNLDLAEIIREAHGRPTIDTIKRMLPGFTEEEQWAERDKFEQDSEHSLDGVVPIAGAAEFLSRAKELRVPTAVVTSAPKDLAVVRFSYTDVPLPDAGVYVDEVERGKPDPLGFKMGAERLGLLARECAAFEDSEAGLQAAVASGAATVVVGDLEKPVTEGLPRISNWRGVAIEPDVEGWFTLTLP